MVATLSWDEKVVLLVDFIELDTKISTEVYYETHKELSREKTNYVISCNLE